VLTFFLESTPWFASTTHPISSSFPAKYLFSTDTIMCPFQMSTNNWDIRISGGLQCIIGMVLSMNLLVIIMIVFWIGYLGLDQHQHMNGTAST
jgi:hypothetical protein